MSHYRVLGVPRGATRVEIRAAYVRAARRTHPDLHRGADPPSRRRAAEQMSAVNEAWRVLGDTSRRRMYDADRIARASGATATVRPGARASSADTVERQRPERIPGRAPAGGRGNPLVLVPAGLFGLAVLQLFFLGLLVGVPTMLATGAVTFALSVAAFAAAPLLVLASGRSHRRPVVG